MPRPLTLLLLVPLLGWSPDAHALPPGAEAWAERPLPRAFPSHLTHPLTTPMPHPIVHPHAHPHAQSGIRGVTIGPIESIQHPRRGYGTEYSARLLDHLVAMGVNYVSITPFGRVWDLQDTEIRMDFEAPWTENRAAVLRMIRQAKERGLGVLLIPHLWVDVPGLWRGEMDPGSPARWEDYQASYRRFVLAWARVAAEGGADAFSIGVECKSWSGRFGAYWSGLIGEVRDTFPGALTYSANWDEAEDVLFWEELDLVGINAFYPLHWENDATDAHYLAGGTRVAERVGALATELDKPILFVEVGYTTRADAAVEPWTWPDGMSDVVVDEREQARALGALLHDVLDERYFAGFFVWRYYANLDDVSQEAIWGFSPHAKMAENTLRTIFGWRWAVDRAPVWEVSLLPVSAHGPTQS